MMLRTGKSGQYRYLTCAAQATRGKMICSGQTICMDVADEAVIAEVEGQVFQPDRLNSILGEMVEHSQSGRARLEQEIVTERARASSASKQLANLYDFVAKGLTDIDDPILKQKIDGIKLQKSEAESTIVSLKHRLSYQPIELTPTALKEFSVGVKERLRSADPAFRRDWLRLFVDRVIVGPNEIKDSRPQKGFICGRRIWRCIDHNTGAQLCTRMARPKGFRTSDP